MAEAEISSDIFEWLDTDHTTGYTLAHALKSGKKVSIRSYYWWIYYPVHTGKKVQKIFEETFTENFIS